MEVKHMSARSLVKAAVVFVFDILRRAPHQSPCPPQENLWKTPALGGLGEWGSGITDGGESLCNANIISHCVGPSIAVCSVYQAAWWWSDLSVWRLKDLPGFRGERAVWLVGPDVSPAVIGQALTSL